MRLSGLAIRHFRNLGSQDLELPPEGVALVGDNAQGKSNFLEAIYYLETFRSFRGARDEQLIAFGEDVFRLVGTTARDGDGAERRGEVTAAFRRRGRKKKVAVDGADQDRVGQALGRLAAVVFSPADIELVSGGPGERRRFLDVVLSLNQPGYLESIQSYRRVLDQRNAALKGGATGATVAAWNSGLINAGAEVIQTRRSWIEAHSGAFGDYYARVSNGVRACMTYRSSVPLGGALDGEGVRVAFRDALIDTCERERRQRVTVVGPHRDDVRLHVGAEGRGLDLREYGSGGQRRTAALALRLVEAMTIRESRSRRPLILLDDVFAELDGGRSERVLELMEAEETGQVLLTAPKDNDVRLGRDTLPRWRIDGGRIAT